MSRPWRTRRGAAIARSLLLVLCGALFSAGCAERTRVTTGPLDSGRLFNRHSPALLWDLYAEACEYEARHGREVEHPYWLPRRAESELAKFISGDLEHREELGLAGLARLGLAGDTTRSEFPLGKSDDPFARSATPLWRVRLQRQLADLPEPDRRDVFEARWLTNWRSAVKSGDLAHLARLAEMLDLTSYHDVVPDDGRAEVWAALSAVQPAVNSVYDALSAARLLERYGIPPGFDLEGWRSAVARRLDRLADAAIPLPHPYDLDLALQRLDRL